MKKYKPKKRKLPYIHVLSSALWFSFSSDLFNCINELKGDSIHGRAIDLSYDILAKLSSHGFGLYSYPIPNRTDWIDVESPVYTERNAVP
jgi:hypothetical protein